MKTYLKLCFSIVRKNLSFTLGLFILSVLATAIAFLGANLGDSSERSVADYLSGSHMPGALVTTDLLPVGTAQKMEATEGIAKVYPRLTYETHIRLADGKLYSARLFSWDESCPLRQTEYETSELPDGVPEALLSHKFAEKAGVKAGDTLYTETPAGFREAAVSALVSSPETLACVYDGMSAYENSSFTCMYLHPEDMEAFTGVSGLANQWLIYFTEGMDTDAEKAALKKTEQLAGDRFLLSEYLAESEAIRSIYDDTDTIRVLCGFLPLLIWLISLGFSFIFVRIIILNQRRMIGLLRALGYSAGRVTGLFAVYTALISLLSLMPGIPLGGVLLRLGTGAVCSATEIRSPVLVTDLPRTFLMLFAMLLTGVFAAILSTGMIARTDPAEAYGGKETDLFEPPAFVSRLRTDAFFKLSLTSVLRSLPRQCVGALCICACVIIICVGFEGIHTIGYPIDAVYGGRFTYDIMVRGLSEGSYDRISREARGLARVEPATMFTAGLLGETVRVSTIGEDSLLVHLQDKDGHPLLPGNGIIIDEMRAEMNGLAPGDTVMLDSTPLTITGIAREILYCVQYISPETARMMGHRETNCAFLSLEAGADTDQTCTEILGIDRGAYFAVFNAQKETIRGGFSGIRIVMGLFAVLGFGIGSMLMANMSIIDFNSNRSRFSILRALGAGAGRLTLVPLMENTFRALAGIILAIPACGLCTRVLLKALSGATQQYVFVEYEKCLLISCLIPCIYVLISVILSRSRLQKLNYPDDLNGVE